MKDTIEPILKRLTEEVAAKPRAAVYVILGLSLALVVAVLV